MRISYAATLECSGRNHRWVQPTRPNSPWETTRGARQPDGDKWAQFRRVKALSYTRFFGLRGCNLFSDSEEIAPIEDNPIAAMTVAEAIRRARTIMPEQRAADEAAYAARRWRGKDIAGS